MPRRHRAATEPNRLARQRGGIVLDHRPFEPRIIAWGVVAGLVLALVAAAVGWPLSEATPLAGEVDTVRRLEVSGSPGLRDLAAALSHVGHLVPVAWIAAVVAALARWRWGSWDLGLLLLVVLGGASAVTGTVKLLTSRARPDEAFVDTLSSAFPSGHAVRAAAVYGLIMWLTMLVTRRTWLRLGLIALVVLLVAVNALARVALAAHWPSDVLVGVAIGMAWLVISLRLLGPRTLVEARRRAGVAPEAWPGPDEDGSSGDGAPSDRDRKARGTS